MGLFTNETTALRGCPRAEARIIESRGAPKSRSPVVKAVTVIPALIGSAQLLNAPAEKIPAPGQCEAARQSLPGSDKRFSQLRFYPRFARAPRQPFRSRA